MKYVAWKGYQAIIRDMKRVYQSPTEEAALMALDVFAEILNEKYPQISKSWRAHEKT